MCYTGEVAAGLKRFEYFKSNEENFTLSMNVPRYDRILFGLIVLAGPRSLATGVAELRKKV